MNFIEQLHDKYLVVAAPSSLAGKLLKLASDILALHYDEATEKKLLAVLEKAYECVQGTKVTADAKWDKSIRENREKQKKRKEQMSKDNERVKSDMKSGKLKHYRDSEYSHPVNKGKEAKREIAKKVEQMGNVISVDFSRDSKPDKKQASEPSVFDKHEQRGQSDYRQRLERVSQSLQKINALMDALRKTQDDEEGPKHLSLT